MQYVVVVHFDGQTVGTYGGLYFQKRSEVLALDGNEGRAFVFGGRLIMEVTLACGPMRGTSAGFGFEEAGLEEHGLSARGGGFHFFPFYSLIGGSQDSQGELG
jgi:hypothetical protein